MILSGITVRTELKKKLAHELSLLARTPELVIIQVGTNVKIAEILLATFGAIFQIGIAVQFRQYVNGEPASSVQPVAIL